MKRSSIIVFLCMSIFMLCSCEFTKWDNYEELAGEWYCDYPPFMKGSKLMFNADGTCSVENVPTKDAHRGLWEEYYTLFWWKARGNERFQKKMESMDKWNFQGYWKVIEDTLYYRSKPYYRYRVQISPHKEILGTEQERNSFMNNTNADDAFWVELDAWADTFFPPARLHCLSFYTYDPDVECCFFKKNKRSRIIQRLKERIRKE